VTMRTKAISGTDLKVFPLCFGCNPFGWTVGRDGAFEVLDAYRAAGGNFLDTADAYCVWVDGVGGQSEQMIGEWHSARGNRDELVIATKVGQKPGRTGLSATNVGPALDESLERLRTDRVDIFYAHVDDETVPLEETLGAFAELVDAGKARYLGASNYTAARLQEALAISDTEGLPRFAIVEPEYNLLHRDYEAELASVCAREGIDCVPYFALAKGFLTGKYRRPEDPGDSARAEAAKALLDERGLAVLGVLDEIAATRGVAVGAVALAWLAAKPTVAAPIASARTADQLHEIVAMATLDLSPEEVARLDAVSAA
jgi:aryl-alcohol dehydrogenase-like predicted oxidoreductase